MTPSRLDPFVLLVSAAACSGSGSSSTSTPARGDFVCIYGTAKCFPDICAGCTVGPDGACPPKDSAFSEVCSEDFTEQNCRDRAVGPERVSPSSSQQRYTRDVRILHGIATCAKFREAGEQSASSVEAICTGNCE
jgi:hypothetical protein